MQAIMRRLKKEEKGFTLIELLAVIVILGVIAVIAVPMISNIIGDTKKDADVSTARQVYDAARLYNTAENNGTMATVDIDTLQTNGYLEDHIYLPSTKKEIQAGRVVFNATTQELTNVILVTSAATIPTTLASEDKDYPAADVLQNQDN